MPDALPRHPRSDACRLCLVTTEKMTMIFNDPALVSAITETVHLKIFEGDGLPARVCYSCVNQLDSASRFIQRCHMSDAELRLPLYKESVRVPELEVIASDNMEVIPSDNMEVIAEESKQEGNWACSLTPVKMELKQEVECLPISAGCTTALPEINLKAEIVEHSPETEDPLEESHGLDEMKISEVPSPDLSSPVVWSDSTTNTAAPDTEWHTNLLQTHQTPLGWQNNSLQPPSELIWKSQPLQADCNDEWENNSLQAYSNHIWQQHESAQQVNSTNWQPKTNSKDGNISLNEVSSTFNIGEDGVFIESNLDPALPAHESTLSCEPFLSHHLFGLSDLSKNEEVFRCHLCSKSFPSHRALSCHINMGHLQKRHHKEAHHLAYAPSMPDKSQLWCSLCSAGFLERGELVKHLQKHKGQSSYCCSRCSKGFHSQQALKVHIKTHAKEKRYKCTKCDKSFSLRSYFRVHELTHKN